MKNEDSTKSDDLTWAHDFTDFSLVLESGEELRCHKIILCKNSSFFKAMLGHNFKESDKNQMTVTDVTRQTLVDFLEYIYKEAAPSEHIELIRSLSPAKHVFKRSFTRQKFTPELLKIGHEYQVQDLQDDCIGHLKENITDENAVEIWIEAERCESVELRKAVLGHLVEARDGDHFQAVPGIEDIVYQSPQMMKQLVGFLLKERLQTGERLKKSEMQLESAEGDVDHLVDKLREFGVGNIHRAHPPVHGQSRYCNCSNAGR